MFGLAVLAISSNAFPQQPFAQYGLPATNIPWRGDFPYPGATLIQTEPVDRLPIISQVSALPSADCVHVQPTPVVEQPQTVIYFAPPLAPALPPLPSVVQQPQPQEPVIERVYEAPPAAPELPSLPELPATPILQTAVAEADCDHQAAPEIPFLPIPQPISIESPPQQQWQEPITERIYVAPPTAPELPSLPELPATPILPSALADASSSAAASATVQVEPEYGLPPVPLFPIVQQPQPILIESSQQWQEPITERVYVAPPVAPELPSLPELPATLILPSASADASSSAAASATVQIEPQYGLPPVPVTHVDCDTPLISAQPPLPIEEPITERIYVAPPAAPELPPLPQLPAAPVVVVPSVPEVHEDCDTSSQPELPIVPFVAPPIAPALPPLPELPVSRPYPAELKPYPPAVPESNVQIQPPCDHEAPVVIPIQRVQTIPLVLTISNAQTVRRPIAPVAPIVPIAPIAPIAPITSFGPYPAAGPISHYGDPIISRS